MGIKAAWHFKHAVLPLDLLIAEWHDSFYRWIVGRFQTYCYGTETKGLIQTQLAEALMYCRYCASCWEQGKRIPDTDMSKTCSGLDTQRPISLARWMTPNVTQADCWNSWEPGWEWLFFVTSEHGALEHSEAVAWLWFMSEWWASGLCYPENREPVFEELVVAMMTKFVLHLASLRVRLRSVDARGKKVLRQFCEDGR